MWSRQCLLIILLALFMVKTACNGCGTKYERLSNHQPTCKAFNALYSGLQTHIDNQEKIRQDEESSIARQAELRREEAARREREDDEARARAEVRRKYL